MPRKGSHTNKTHPLARRGRDLYDWLMFGVGLAGVLGIVATLVIGQIHQAGSDSDTSNAMNRMDELVGATSDEANATSAEVPDIQRQAKAAADSAAAAKTTAGLAKGQTAAIIQQASALIQGAQATIKAADAELASAQANTRAAQAGLEAADKQRQSAELFASTRAPSSILSSVQITGWNSPPDSNGIVLVTIKPIYTNTGGGTLFPLSTTFNVTLGKTLPNEKPAADQNTFGGNDNPITSSGTYFPNTPFKYEFPKAAIDAVNAHKTGIIVWGVMLFFDVSKKQYAPCYLDIVNPPNAEEPQSAVRSAFAKGYCER